MLIKFTKSAECLTKGLKSVYNGCLTLVNILQLFAPHVVLFKIHTNKLLSYFEINVFSAKAESEGVVVLAARRLQ